MTKFDELLMSDDSFALTARENYENIKDALLSLYQQGELEFNVFKLAVEKAMEYIKHES